MNMRKLLAGSVLAPLFLSLFLTLLWLTTAQASTNESSAAVQKMATIMHRLKHYPSPQGKRELQVIIDDAHSSDNERAMARAMMNLQHKAMGEDKARMKQIMEDAQASASERDLAGIIYHLDHRPSGADKQKLEMMMHKTH